MLAARQERASLTRSVVVDAPVAEVWARVVTAEGIDHELRPLLSMTMPAGLREASIDTVPVGRPLGRAYLRLGGLLPVEYDDLVLVDVDPPRSFHERSSMASARVWEHRRVLDPVGDTSTQVTDHLRIEPRLPLPPVLLRTIVDLLFAQRHRRLRTWFTGSGTGRREH